MKFLVILAHSKNMNKYSRIPITCDSFGFLRTFDVVTHMATLMLVTDVGDEMFRFKWFCTIFNAIILYRKTLASLKSTIVT